MRVVENSLRDMPLPSHMARLTREGDIEQFARKAKVGQAFDVSITDAEDPTGRRRAVYARLRRWARHNSKRDEPIKFATRYMGNNIIRAWRIQ